MDGTRFTAEVLLLGRVTIPKAVRKALNINDGDIVELEVKKKVKEGQ